MRHRPYARSWMFAIPVASALACSAPDSPPPEARSEAVASAVAACAHDVCATGARLKARCSACAANVCAGDAYCCTTAWDAQCVREAKSSCDGACAPPPPAPPPPSDAGAPSGAIGASGGTATQLLFGVVGDTRPATKDDTAGYPTDVATQIYADLAARSDAPLFVVSTGDYNFSSPDGAASADQFDLYLQARAHYAGAWFPAMGNHECTGQTDSNCGPSGADGVTQIYSNYLSKLLGPIQKKLPYYTIHVNATDGSWTAKFVFVAANAWDAAQEKWLQGAMAEATTYTFVVRHEAASVTSAPGVSPSEKIVSAYPYTLEIVGHSHTYAHAGRELLVGNGGAPLTGSVNYGYALLRQRGDMAIVVDMYDYQTNAADASFHFAVGPDGSPASP